MTPAPPEKNTRHARHLYTILVKLENVTADRDAIQQALQEENIGTGIHYISLHLHQYYCERYGFKPDDFPKALYVSERTISLPLSTKLTDDDVQDVIDAVKNVLGRYCR